MVPWVMSTRSCAAALPANPIAETAIASSMASRKTRAGLTKFITSKLPNLSAEHLPGVKDEVDLPPQCVFFWPEYVAEGRALDDGTERTLRRHLRQWIAHQADAEQLRLAGERAVLQQADAYRHDERAGLAHADRRVPALVKAGLQGGELALRHLGVGVAVDGAERLRLIDGHGIAAARRVALVEERG